MVRAKKYLAGLALCGSWCFSVPLYADCSCPKLGFIDSERVYSETRQAQRINVMLQQEFAARYEKLGKMKKEGVALQKQADAERNIQKRSQLQQQFDQFRRRYAAAEQQLVEEYSLRRNEEFTALQQRANRVISDFKQKEGYNWISDNAVFVDKKFDITDEIIKALDNNVQ